MYAGLENTGKGKNMSKYRTMPREIHGGTVPSVAPADWLAEVERLLGRQIGKADSAYARALREYHGWTATVVADHLRKVDAMDDVLAACELLLTRGLNAAEVLGERGETDGFVAHNTTRALEQEVRKYADIARAAIAKAKGA